MAFDYAAYQKEKEELLSKLEQFSDQNPKEIQETASKIRNLFDKMENIQNYDQKIGVCNYPFWMRKVTGLIETDQINEYHAGYFNLKRFSLINSRFGRETGTAVMKRFMERLSEVAGEDGMICRTSGDNFAILFRKKYLEGVMEYLQGTSVSMDGSADNRIYVQASAGYYLIPKEESIKDVNEIMDRLRETLHMARNLRKVPYVFWNSEMMFRQAARKNIEEMFKGSIEQEEFLVYYQPKVNLRDYSLSGAEALCRWKHNGKLVPPNEFIPILEQSYDICALDFYMLDHVCRDVQRWRKEGRKIVKVSVNLSRRHMDNPLLLEQILEIIDRYEVPHHYIEFELTETTTDVEFKDLKRIVAGLQEQDIRTSVDDFGVGYSSLNLIRELPWNVLKIDKSFLPAIEGRDVKKDTVFKQLISLAQSLGLECIVEGVETVEQVRILKKNHCYLAQGFYFDRPLPVKIFENRLEANSIEIA